MEDELQQLRDLLIAQQKQSQEQTEELKKQLKEQQEKVQSLQDRLNDQVNDQLNASGAAAANSVATSVVANAAVGTSLGNVSSSASVNGNAEQANDQAPTAIHVKGITLTPGGFMEAANVWRQKALSADVTTPFNSIPFPGSSQSQVSEFNWSGRQSRISMLVEGKLSGVKIGGYYETDFLGTGITSNYTESNSYVLRQRQFWGQAAFDSGWTITGGQMWTLITETKHGLDNRTEALPLVIDGSYHVGFSWARQPGIRITKDFGDKIWLGFSIENAETTLTAHGENNNFIVGAFGASGGSLNPVANYAFSTAPDFVFKAAFEPGWGHYEIFGVVSTFRDRVFPNETAATPSAAGAYNDRRAGGGIGANARVPLFHKKLDAGLHFFGGDGIGRYGASTLADVTVRPDGTLAPIRSFQSLGTLEWHTTPKLDVYAYVGGEYAGRTSYTKTGATAPDEGYGASGLPNYGCFTEPLPGSSTSTPTGVGGSTGFIPGSLANCTGDTRNVIEGTLGFWYRFYKGPRVTVQWGPQYSYMVRNTWSGEGATAGTSAAPHGIDNMVMTSFRYYLP
ncbi:MAG: OmpH family outer membrane protein [Candidatus Acidiferrales bacterium]